MAPAARTAAISFHTRWPSRDERQGGEGGEFEELGGVVGIDEGADGQAAAGGEVAIDHGFGSGAMAKSGGQGQDAGAGDHAWRNETQAATAGQHQRGQGHAEGGGGFGELAIGFGWIEAEWLSALQAGKGKQRRTLGIEK